MGRLDRVDSFVRWPAEHSGRATVALLAAAALCLCVFAGQPTGPAVAESGSHAPAGEGTGKSALCILVTDPLSHELACDCVAGFAQRRYEALALVLEQRLGQHCKIVCGERIAAYWTDKSPVHLIIGKYSDVLYQVKRLGRRVEPIASLTDRDGKTTLQGLFVVRAGNPAKSLRDLKGYRILFGPPSCAEKHEAAIEALRAAGVEPPDQKRLAVVDSCTAAAAELMRASDEAKLAAVISDYARVLLEGCGTVPPGSLRVVGRTKPVPFVTVFATEQLDPQIGEAVLRELLGARRFPTLLELLESRDGFKPFAKRLRPENSPAAWTGFRGPERTAVVPYLPASLERLRVVWAAPLAEPGLGGVAATERWVAVTDQSPGGGRDWLKLFDAYSGAEVLRAELVRPAVSEPDPELDFGNTIRATPLIYAGRIYVLDAYGTLFACPLPEGELSAKATGEPPVSLPLPQAAGEIALHGLRTEWLVDRFKLGPWGVSSSPLIVDGKLIVNTSGTRTSLLALDPDTLELLWRGPGDGTGHASCVAVHAGDRLQIVGYQRELLAGWDAASGELLWYVRPRYEGDYNVPTPVPVGDRRLLVVTENNAMRLYEFDQSGRLRPEPVATNEDVATDTVTPVAVNGVAYCTSNGQLFAVDLNAGLKTLWSVKDRAFATHVSLIADASGRRLLVAAASGELLLFDVSGRTPTLLSRRMPAGLIGEEHIYSHPALVGNRLYLRGSNVLLCLQLSERTVLNRQRQVEASQ